MSQTAGQALIVVDVQNDFFPGGALAVAHGDEIIPAVNRLTAWFAARGLPIYFTRDWHPRNHCSFAEFGGPWPVHCVQESAGAAFHPAVALPAGLRLVSKAETSERDAYSGFQGTGLAAQLAQQGIGSVVVCGLATDYCVRATALDARQEGLAVYVVDEAIRGVDVHPGDSAHAKEEMQQAGVLFVALDALESALPAADAADAPLP